MTTKPNTPTQAPAATEAPSDEQINALWAQCNQPSEANDWTTGPLPFARALLALAAVGASPEPASVSENALHTAVLEAVGLMNGCVMTSPTLQRAHEALRNALIKFADASVQPVQASIEGTVTFMRSDAADTCRCCPPGGHIFARYVKYDEWDTKHPKHFGNGADVLTAAFVTDKNENEGKRVRVTVEVLASSTPTKGGQTS